MARYNYKCSACGDTFDIEATLKEKEEGSEKFICPECGAKKIKQNFSAVNFIKNIFASENKGGCCGGDIQNINCKPNKNNPDGYGDKKSGHDCCG